jgi:hypothetical protein
VPPGLEQPGLALQVLQPSPSTSVAQSWCAVHLAAYKSSSNRAGQVMLERRGGVTIVSKLILNPRHSQLGIPVAEACI